MRLTSPLLDPVNDFRVRNAHHDPTVRSVTEHERAIASAIRPRLEALPV